MNENITPKTYFFEVTKLLSAGRAITHLAAMKRPQKHFRSAAAGLKID